MCLVFCLVKKYSIYYVTLYEISHLNTYISHVFPEKIYDYYKYCLKRLATYRVLNLDYTYIT